MALVRFEMDEQYRHFIYRADGIRRPWWSEPVEVPDELLAEYEAAFEEEHRLRMHIVETYGKDDD